MKMKILKEMKKVDEYIFKPENRKVALYQFDTKEEMEKSGLLNNPKRHTCFVSDGKYYVGLYMDTSG
jgi:hypothetical protein